MFEPLHPPFQAFTPRSLAEATFLGKLVEADLALDLWWSDDPWVAVTLTEIRDGVASDNARLDFDGSSIRGGYDPSGLQDMHTRIELTRVDFGPPDGIALTGSPEELAAAASAWFAEVWARWQNGRRYRPVGRIP
jgi:hypothetical protein